MLCASFALGCGTTSFSARVADPRAVAVDDAETGAPILPPGADRASARESIPRTTGGWVARGSTGAITFGSDHPDTHLAVTADGAVPFASAPGAQSETRDFRATYDYTWQPSPWLRGRYRPAPEIASYVATLRTPWTNVVEIREHRRFDRSTGRAMMVFAGVFMLFGALTIASGITAPYGANSSIPGKSRVVIGGVFMAGGGLVLGFGAFNAFADEPERVLYRR